MPRPCRARPTPAARYPGGDASHERMRQVTGPPAGGRPPLHRERPESCGHRRRAGVRAAWAKPTMVHIDGAAQQNAAGAEEVAASARSLQQPTGAEGGGIPPASTRRHRARCRSAPAWTGLTCGRRAGPIESAPLQRLRVAAGPGEVSEWLKEHAWKVCKRLNRASGVRIPLSPPDSCPVRPEHRKPGRALRGPRLWWPRRPLATLGRKSRQGRKAATVSIDAGAEVSRRGRHLFGPPRTVACTACMRGRAVNVRTTPQ